MASDRTRWFAAPILGVALTACGGLDTSGGAGGSGGAGDHGACVKTDYCVWVRNDPEGGSDLEVRNCTDDGGSWVDRCSSAELVGICSVSLHDGSSQEFWYYAGQTTAASVETRCEGLGAFRTEP